MEIDEDVVLPPQIPPYSKGAPNILITGTPGVGKSTLSKKLENLLGFSWLEISKLAKDHNCLEQYDEEYKCPILDEDRLMDLLEETMACGGNIVDYHSCEFFPERWFDAVFVLLADNTTIYDRLSGRGYEGKKLEDNVQCEIFQTILEEAKNSYKPEIVFELKSFNETDMTENINTISAWVAEWFKEKERQGFR